MGLTVLVGLSEYLNILTDKSAKKTFFRCMNHHSVNNFSEWKSQLPVYPDSAECHVPIDVLAIKHT